MTDQEIIAEQQKIIGDHETRLTALQISLDSLRDLVEVHERLLEVLQK